MSHSDDKNAKKRRPIADAAVDSMSDRFQSAVSVSDAKKPDSKDFSLGSPVSPLGNRPASTAITNTSSSSSSSGSVTGRTGSNAPARKKYDGKSHSGEISGSGDSQPTSVGSPGTLGQRNSKPGHRRSGSGQLIFSAGGSSATSPNTNVLPAGNICPSGKIAKTGMMSRSAPRSDVLGSGTGNYGHGSIMRGGAAITRPPAETSLSTSSAETANAAAVKAAMSSIDPEEVKKAGNEQYRMGRFSDALKLYDRAIKMCPANPTCRSNRAAALIGLGRLPEAVRECEEAVRLDPAYSRAHHRLASLYIRLGQVESAKKHISSAGKDADQAQLQKVQAIEKHLKRSGDVRKIRDWPSVIRESDAAIAAGADSSPLLFASKSEALLHLNRPEEADSLMAKASKLELSLPGASQTSYSDIRSNAYVFIVQALLDMNLGRFENAISAAEKATRADPSSLEAATVFSNVRGVIRARSRGNDLFKSEMFAEACTAYGEGLRFDPSNPVLHCNRAVCFSKLEQWEKSVLECDEALKVHPNHAKALLRRAASNCKLEKWAEAVADYQKLRKLIPADREVAEAMFHAQVALKKSRGEEVSNLSFGGEVEKISTVEHFRDGISLPGVVLVHFMSSRNQPCLQIAQFVDGLCSRYPTVNFLRVDVDESPEVAGMENVKVVPAFKIYKQGTKVKEMVCPSRQLLENSVRHYSV